MVSNLFAVNALSFAASSIIRQGLDVELTYNVVTDISPQKKVRQILGGKPKDIEKNSPKEK